MSGIEINQLVKSFGKTSALKGISTLFLPGHIYGLLGRNGAGKSTAMNIMANRIFPDSGSVTLNGESLIENDRAQRRIYLMSEKDGYPRRMKVMDAFLWTSRFYPGFDLNYAMTAAGRFALDPSKQVRSLTTGYLTIFKLIAALSTNAEFLLLDEPVLGLDACHRELFYHMLREKCSRQPTTVILSTPLIEEISSVIDRVVVIDQGKIIEQGSCEDLKKKGYGVKGPKALVNRYISGKDLWASEETGEEKLAYILGRPAEDCPLPVLEIDLRKLFLLLTNSERSRR